LGLYFLKEELPEEIEERARERIGGELWG